jgi:hypothetical protein
MKNLNNSFNGLTQDEVLSLSYKELQMAVLRMFNVKIKNCEDYHGSCVLPDELADAFRNNE